MRFLTSSWYSDGISPRRSDGRNMMDDWKPEGRVWQPASKMVPNDSCLLALHSCSYSPLPLWSELACKINRVPRNQRIISDGSSWKTLRHSGSFALGKSSCLVLGQSNSVWRGPPDEEMQGSQKPALTVREPLESRSCSPHQARKWA